MNRLFDLLAECRSKGIYFSLDASGTQLKIRGNTKLLSEEEVSVLRSHKSHITELLNRSAEAVPVILPAAPQEHYTLSYAQQRMWVLERLSMGNAAYHITMSNVFEGILNIANLKIAVDLLIERHQILRTVFKEDESAEVRQYILAPEELKFSVSLNDCRQHNDIDVLLLSAHQQTFDLEKGPLLRAGLYQLTDNKWIFDLVIHHIICDGWSMDILIRDLMGFYTALCSGERYQVAPLLIQYQDYACWQKQQIISGALRSYWLNQFEGELPVLALPADKTRPPIKTNNGGSIRKIVCPEHTKALKEMMRQQGCTLFAGLMTVVQALLYRYTAQEDMIIGFPVAGREAAVLEDQIGLYLNTLALRLRCAATESYLDIAQRMKKLIPDAQMHQAYPFDLLTDELHQQGDMSRNPLFDVMVTLKEKDMELPQAMNDLHISAYKLKDGGMSKFDLSFHFIDQDDTLELELIYNNDIYLPATAKRLADNFVGMLSAVIRHPEMPLAELEYISREEIEALLGSSNNTSEFPAELTVPDMFVEQALRTPDVTAVVCGKEQLSYAALHEKTEQLANLLFAHHHVRADDMIAVMLDRSVDMILAIFGILKSGAAYVPIDPEYPAERIAYILKDAGAAVLITHSDYLPRLGSYTGEIIAIDKDQPAAAARKLLIKQQQLAYMIYTSGTSGHPKGVMINHGSLVDYFYGIAAKTNISGCQHFGLVSTIAADLGNTIIYTSLLLGGTLHIYDTASLMDAGQIFDDPPDCIKIVPSHWKSLQDTDKLFLPRKCLIFGGESLTADVLEMIKAADHTCEVYNHYGPSETTIGKLIQRINLDYISMPVALGAPFCQSSVYILDSRHKLLPAGVVGEICIAGAGLARGYFRRPDITAEKFVADPFRVGERMYKTGDLGRWLPDGKIEFRGRKDDQVKIRGYRVEPGEIAAVICEHPQVEAAVVLIKAGTDTEKELVAYILPKPGFDVSGIRSWLSQHLPSWMIPVYYIALDKIPLTLNGKTDKRLLPDPISIRTRQYLAPRNDIEIRLLGIWQELLGEKEIGVKDSFFEAGGHSLKMMQLITRINRSFSIRINIQSIFKEPTIENMSEQVSFILDQNRQKMNRENLKQVEI